MLFDVILLRHRGKKLMPNDLPGPVRGVVEIERERLDEDGVWKLRATLKSERSTYSRGAPHMLPALYGCKITAMDNRGMVLVGHERFKESEVAQAWWCRPTMAQPPRG